MLKELEKQEAAARAHVATTEAARTAAAGVLAEAEKAQRTTFDAYNPNDLSAKALAPVEQAKARVDACKHHLAKADAVHALAKSAHASAVAAVAAEKARLRRAEFDEVADRFGMRGWENGNASRFAKMLEHFRAARDLLGEMLNDVARWNEPAAEIFEIASRHGFIDEIPERAGVGLIANRMRGHVHEPPLAVRAVDSPMDSRERRAWGKHQVRRLKERVFGSLPKGTEIDPAEYFYRLDLALKRAKPANTPSGTVSADPYLFDSEEAYVALLALQDEQREFHSSRPSKFDDRGKPVDSRMMVRA